MSNTAIPAEAAGEFAALPPLRILVADDDRDFTATLIRLLQYEGYVTRGAHSAPQIQAAMLNFAPDVVFLDIGMPGRSGFDVAHELRNLYGTARPVLIAITGRTDERDKRVARMAGFDHYVTKPYDLAALFDLLRSLKVGQPSDED